MGVGLGVLVGICVSVGAGVGEKVGTAVTKTCATAVPVSVAPTVRVGGRVAGTAISGVQAPNISKISSNPMIFVCVVNMLFLLSSLLKVCRSYR
ncbi:MAG TPA: hypothetical protein PLK31_04940 [Chloroflexota bacterium]|nr:hypothetical protein [Chloroflexota bacterium]